MRFFIIFLALISSYCIHAQQFTGSSGSSGVVQRQGAISLPVTGKGFILNTSQSTVDATWGSHNYGLSKADPQKLNLSTSGYGKLQPVVGGYYGVGLRSKDGMVSLLMNGIMTVGLDQSKIDDLNDQSAANNDPYRLYVGGGVRTEDVMVNLQASWPDYVFDESYKMMSLSQIQNFIKEKGHLPNMPSSAEVYAKGGINLKDIAVRQQQTIEELVLHIIDLNDRIVKLEEKE